MTHSEMVVSTQKWWMNELQKLTQKIMHDEEKRQEKAKAREYDLLSDYSSEDEILDAYGFGCITERKKDKLLDLWQKRENETGEEPIYRMKLDLIAELYEEAKVTIENNSKGESI